MNKEIDVNEVLFMFYNYCLEHELTDMLNEIKGVIHLKSMIFYAQSIGNMNIKRKKKSKKKQAKR